MVVWASLAWATPVLYDGASEGEHLAAVVSRTGLPPEQLEGVSLSELRERPPAVLGDAVLRRCTGQPSTNAEVRAELVRAEAALSEGDDVAVVDHLDLAVARLSCLSEVVDGPAVARVFLLRGGIAAEAGRVDEARGELVTGLAFDPRIVWPAGYPTEGSEVLAEVGASEVRHELSVVPAPSSGPWVDGTEKAWPAAVRPGLHLAQHSARAGLATSWLVVGGPAAWVLPEALSPSALDRFADDPQPVGKALLATHPEEPAAYVSHGGGLWLVTRSEREARVEQLVAPPVTEEAKSPGKGKKKGK